SDVCSSDLARIELQGVVSFISKGVMILNRETISSVGRVGGSQVRNRTGMFEIHVHYARIWTETPALSQGNLFGIRLGYQVKDKGSCPFLGFNPDKSITQIAIFHRRDSCYDLYAFNIR